MGRHVFARETACLSLEHRLAVDQSVAGDADRLEGLGLGELAGLLRTEAERLDPAAVVKRRRRAEADRHVSLRPAPDTMTYLTALLPVKDGVAAYAALTRAAETARAAGEERGKGQLMADTLVARILGAEDAPTQPPTGPVELGLVMTDQALFAGADDGAHLTGYGPIPAELAREIVAGALTAQERVGIRRLYTSPTTGELVAMESATRTFRGNLAKFIRLRDRTCRTPWCDAPIRHLDHARPDHHGGPTSAINGQGLCEACNYAKEAPGWQARPGPDDAIETMLPTGHSYRTRAPAIATIRQSHLPPLKIDYVLTG